MFCFRTRGYEKIESRTLINEASKAIQSAAKSSERESITLLNVFIRIVGVLCSRVCDENIGSEDFIRLRYLLVGIGGSLYPSMIKQDQRQYRRLHTELKAATQGIQQTTQKTTTLSSPNQNNKNIETRLIYHNLVHKTRRVHQSINIDATKSLKELVSLVDQLCSRVFENSIRADELNFLRGIFKFTWGPAYKFLSKKNKGVFRGIHDELTSLYLISVDMNESRAEDQRRDDQVPHEDKS